MSVREAASRLGVSENTIYRWVEERGLPAYRVNESYRFNAAELLEWANSNPVQPPQSLIEGADEAPPAFTLARRAAGGRGASPG
ncbi:MAG: helix-turn-helix domain-containing protein [Desulfomicrobium escambiense]|nr:helix-turn-helix domain-containing protein [Desulfomicrobium escambiense]